MLLAPASSVWKVYIPYKIFWNITTSSLNCILENKSEIPVVDVLLDFLRYDYNNLLGLKKSSCIL